MPPRTPQRRLRSKRKIPPRDKLKRPAVGRGEQPRVLDYRMRCVTLRGKRGDDEWISPHLLKHWLDNGVRDAQGRAAVGGGSVRSRRDILVFNADLADDCPWVSDLR